LNRSRFSQLEKTRSSARQEGAGASPQSPRFFPFYRFVFSILVEALHWHMA